MKKKMLFMVINMNVGGTERALLNMIAEMPKDQYDITILMLEKYGGFLESIPAHVHKEYLNGYQDMKKIINKPPKKVIRSFLKKGRLIKVLRLLIIFLLSKVTKNNSLLFKYVLKGHPRLTIEYDIAIAYAGPMDFISYFVIHKIISKKKIQWIHFDVTKIGFHKNFATKIYEKFDQLFVVSKEAKEKLLDLVPTVKEKSNVFLNLVSPSLIHGVSKVGKGFADDFSGLRILTVGRLSNEKGQDLAIRACARLINDGYHIRWYCLGEGNARSRYEQLIKENSLQEKFILLGSDPNPYPYIDQCDIYVQPSRYEGYCITLAEARALKKPIVTTNFTGAKEQIKDGKTGIIADVNEEEIYRAVKKLISNPKKRQELSMNLLKETLESIDIMDQIYNMI